MDIHLYDKIYKFCGQKVVMFVLFGKLKNSLRTLSYIAQKRYQIIHAKPNFLTIVQNDELWMNSREQEISKLSQSDLNMQIQLFLIQYGLTSGSPFWAAVFLQKRLQLLLTFLLAFWYISARFIWTIHWVVQYLFLWKIIENWVERLNIDQLQIKIQN